MVLVIVLNIIAVVGIFYGIAKKNKTILYSSITGLIIIEVLILVYNYLYAQNPY
jgi:riboflavin transporter FmnP